MPADRLSRSDAQSAHDSIRHSTTHDGPSRWYESAAGVDDPRSPDCSPRSTTLPTCSSGPTSSRSASTVPIGGNNCSTRCCAPSRPSSRRPAPMSADGGTRGAGAHVPRGRLAIAARRARARTRVEGARVVAPGRARRPRAHPRGVSSTEQCRSSGRGPPPRRCAVARSPNQQWSRLLADASRAVRRATVDAMVDVERPVLRPLLERALGDADAWTRWKALRGLVDLGVGPSRAAVAPLADDPDFRVRLEATGASHGFGESE